MYRHHTPSRHHAPVAGCKCLVCPNRTVTTSMMSTSINKCECQGGSYHKLARVGEMCEECPHGMYCQGSQLPPVQKTGFWSKPEIYPNAVTVLAVACNYRNVRGVCVGYPDVQNQTTLQLCLYHPHSPWCTRTFNLQNSSSPLPPLAMARTWRRAERGGGEEVLGFPPGRTLWDFLVTSVVGVQTFCMEEPSWRRRGKMEWT